MTVVARSLVVLSRSVPGVHQQVPEGFAFPALTRLIVRSVENVCCRIRVGCLANCARHGGKGKMGI
jgi:hypothetical protein